MDEKKFICSGPTTFSRAPPTRFSRPTCSRSVPTPTSSRIHPRRHQEPTSGESRSLARTRTLRCSDHQRRQRVPFYKEFATGPDCGPGADHMFSVLKTSCGRWARRHLVAIWRRGTTSLDYVGTAFVEAFKAYAAMKGCRAEPATDDLIEAGFRRPRGRPQWRRRSRSTWIRSPRRSSA